ncbi:NADP-dependent oxidoreductase [Nocardioides sp. CFH 31398]|uniref:NADP-dependent oxidoreductase n=1 Tax=Nocardioides sp. CFH 31398 TaxID=2919579 RepID=UPI001F06140A|nr:NADP-dependent oxidoreductase [Nocardioides sp. CFH 31398]MCH1868531.1 NADP-dependent oxidoreductase [Nocardioides sp. CFH 31398]
MRAIGVTEYGGPEALHELDLPAEDLGPHQVRLRVAAAAVNPTDTGLRSGMRDESPTAPPPGAVPGMDVAGTVVEVGDPVEGLAEGDRVMGIVVPDGPHGAYREDLVLSARSVTPVPDSLSDAEAASLPMNGLTAMLALDLLGLEAGQVLAVTGAAGAFGGYVVQLAVARGITVVADAKEGEEDLVLGLGADVVVPRGDGVTEAVLTELPDGVDGLADGSLQGADVLPMVKEGGHVATVRGYQGDGSRGLHVHPVWVREAAERRDWLDELVRLAVTGQVTPRVADVLPAAEAPDAHRRLEAGGVRGRLVLDFTA